MSHGFIEFADFDGAWRYSSTPSIATAQLAPLNKVIATPALVHIRAPASRWLNLPPPEHSTLVARRRTQSDAALPTSTPLQPLSTWVDSEANPDAECAYSAILVSYAPIRWNPSRSTLDPHPGSPADLSSGGDVGAVSPKNRSPGVLKKQEEASMRRQTTQGSLSFLEVVEPRGRVGSGRWMLGLEGSPYPFAKTDSAGERKRAEKANGKGKWSVKGWLRRVVGGVRRLG